MSTFFIGAPEWVAEILRNEGVTVAVTDLTEDMLAEGEIGRVEGFAIYTSPPAAFDIEASLPRQKTHGPQKKGRGGKIRRW